jgi:hypothetical protein
VKIWHKFGRNSNRKTNEKKRGHGFTVNASNKIYEKE